MFYMVYKVSCLHDANVSYTGMIFCLLVTRAQENLNLINKIAIIQHISLSQYWKANKLKANTFKITGQCNIDYKVKAHKALLIKIH